MPRTTVRQTRRFDSRLGKLARKYSQVLDAVDNLIEELEEGNRPGTRYRRVGDTIIAICARSECRDLDETQIRRFLNEL